MAETLSVVEEEAEMPLGHRVPASHPTKTRPINVDGRSSSADRFPPKKSMAVTIPLVAVIHAGRRARSSPPQYRASAAGFRGRSFIDIDPRLTFS